MNLFIGWEQVAFFSRGYRFISKKSRSSRTKGQGQESSFPRRNAVPDGDGRCDCLGYRVSGVCPPVGA